MVKQRILLLLTITLLLGGDVVAQSNARYIEYLKEIPSGWDKPGTLFLISTTQYVMEDPIEQPSSREVSINQIRESLLPEKIIDEPLTIGLCTRNECPAVYNSVSPLPVNWEKIIEGSKQELSRNLWRYFALTETGNYVFTGMGDLIISVLWIKTDNTDVYILP